MKAMASATALSSARRAASASSQARDFVTASRVIGGMRVAFRIDHPGRNSAIAAALLQRVLFEEVAERAGAVVTAADNPARPPARTGEAAATGETEAQSGGLDEFVDQACVRAVGLWMPVRKLNEAYTAWCAERGSEPLESRALCAALRTAGFRDKRRRDCDGRQFRAWVGLRLKGGPEAVQ